jgi:hypothetical protein
MKLHYFLILSFLSSYISAFESNHPIALGIPTPIKASLGKTVYESDPCEDLYQATCLIDGTDTHYKNVLDKVKNNHINKIKDIKDRVAKKLNYKDYNDYISKGLSKIGIKLTSEDYIKFNKYLLGFEHDSYKVASTHSMVATCSSMKEKTSKYFPHNGTEEDTKRHIQMIDEFKNNFNSLYSTIAQSSPSTFIEQIIQKCSYDNLSEIHQQLCKLEKLNIDLVALEIHRSSDTVEVNNLTSQLYQKFSDLLLGDLSLNKPIKGNTLSDKYFDLGNNTQCYQISSLLQPFIYSGIDTLLKDFHRTKYFIEEMVDTFYPQSKKESFVQDLNLVKIKMASFFTQSFNKNNPNLNKSLDSLSKVQFGWLEKPKSNEYTIDEKMNTEVHTNGVYRFVDKIEELKQSNLSSFTTINAFYMPSYILGEVKSVENVNILPLLMSLRDDYYWSYLAVLAHEVGHRFDPNVSRASGYDLTNIYKELMSCWKKKDSILLISDQKGEAVSDFLAANVMALISQDHTQEEKEKVLKGTAEMDCLLAFPSTAPNFSNAHPNVILRSSGILGATPAYREALSCVGQSSRFITCGINGQEIDL